MVIQLKKGNRLSHLLSDAMVKQKPKPSMEPIQFGAFKLYIVTNEDGIVTIKSDGWNGKEPVVADFLNQLRSLQEGNPSNTRPIGFNK